MLRICLHTPDYCSCPHIYIVFRVRHTCYVFHHYHKLGLCTVTLSTASEVMTNGGIEMCILLLLLSRVCTVVHCAVLEAIS